MHLLKSDVNIQSLEDKNLPAEHASTLSFSFITTKNCYSLVLVLNHSFVCFFVTFQVSFVIFRGVSQPLSEITNAKHKLRKMFS